SSVDVVGQRQLELEEFLNADRFKELTLTSSKLKDTANAIEAVKKLGRRVEEASRRMQNAPTELERLANLNTDIGKLVADLGERVEASAINARLMEINRNWARVNLDILEKRTANIIPVPQIADFVLEAKAVCEYVGKNPTLFPDAQMRVSELSQKLEMLEAQEESAWVVYQSRYGKQPTDLASFISALADAKDRISALPKRYREGAETLRGEYLTRSMSEFLRIIQDSLEADDVGNVSVYAEQIAKLDGVLNSEPGAKYREHREKLTSLKRIVKQKSSLLEQETDLLARLETVATSQVDMQSLLEESARFLQDNSTLQSADKIKQARKACFVNWVEAEVNKNVAELAGLETVTVEEIEARTVRIEEVCKLIKETSDDLKPADWEALVKGYDVLAEPYHEYAGGLTFLAENGISSLTAEDFDERLGILSNMVLLSIEGLSKNQPYVNKAREVVEADLVVFIKKIAEHYSENYEATKRGAELAAIIDQLVGIQESLIPDNQEINEILATLSERADVWKEEEQARLDEEERLKVFDQAIAWGDYALNKLNSSDLLGPVEAAIERGEEIADEALTEFGLNADDIASIREEKTALEQHKRLVMILDEFIVYASRENVEDRDDIGDREEKLQQNGAAFTKLFTDYFAAKIRSRMKIAKEQSSNALSAEELLSSAEFILVRTPALLRELQDELADYRSFQENHEISFKEGDVVKLMLPAQDRQIPLSLSYKGVANGRAQFEVSLPDGFCAYTLEVSTMRILDRGHQKYIAEWSDSINREVKKFHKSEKAQRQNPVVGVLMQALTCDVKDANEQTSNIFLIDSFAGTPGKEQKFIDPSRGVRVEGRDPMTDLKSLVENSLIYFRVVGTAGGQIQLRVCGSGLNGVYLGEE
ncbi:MAG: hypothetical protein KBC84_06410, partial [Proteobacteria bacterium]|nr:hypothetical protein [Pseudomonadota bacterium]